MSLSLSYAELIALKPCDAPGRKALFKNAERLTAREALAAGATISDLAWVAGRLGLKRQCVQFALACAQRIAHFNADPKVQAALDAAQAWLDNPSDPDAAFAAADAAKAANAAANAAYYAAANAAYYAARAAANTANAAANTAVYAAVYAADADAYAVLAVHAAARAAEKEEQKKLFLEIFDHQ